MQRAQGGEAGGGCPNLGLIRLEREHELVDALLQDGRIGPQDAVCARERYRAGSAGAGGEGHDLRASSLVSDPLALPASAGGCAVRTFQAAGRGLLVEDVAVGLSQAQGGVDAGGLGEDDVCVAAVAGGVGRHLRDGQHRALHVLIQRGRLDVVPQHAKLNVLHDAALGQEALQRPAGDRRRQVARKQRAPGLTEQNRASQAYGPPRVSTFVPTGAGKHRGSTGSGSFSLRASWRLRYR